MVFFFLSVIITYIYCYRMFKGLFHYFNMPLMRFRGSLIFNFCSVILCVMSIFFVWWFSENMFVYSNVLLYFDFYGLLYLVLFSFFLMFFVKVVRENLKYKFLLDFYPKALLRINCNFKFADSFVDGLIIRFFSFFNYFSKYMFNFFARKGLNFLVVIIFFLMVI